MRWLLWWERRYSSTIFTHIGNRKFSTMEMQNSNQKWALRMGSQRWHKFPKQPASMGTWGRGLVGILWVSLKKKGEITDEEQTRPTQGVLTQKRKTSFLWNPNELTRGPSSDRTPMPLPMNPFLRCRVWTRTEFFFFLWWFFFLCITELTRAAVTSAWTPFMPGHNSAVNTSLLLNWPKSAPVSRLPSTRRGHQPPLTFTPSHGPNLGYWFF